MTDTTDYACIKCTAARKHETHAGLMLMLEHARKCSGGADIRRGRLGEPDAHGHLWYCFSCDNKTGKGHKSFDSDQGMCDHLRAVHRVEFLTGSFAIDNARRLARPYCDNGH
jgi:hypothetical protein